jgi:hypothetical protein
MTDEPRSTPPPDDAAVRRLLASARHDEPVPADVAARLDSVLARLEAGESVAGPRGSRAKVVELTAQRRRRVASLLVAAAAVVVLGVGLGQVVDGFGSAGSRSATDAAGDAAMEGEAADTGAGADRDELAAEAAPETMAEDGAEAGADALSAYGSSVAPRGERILVVGGRLTRISDDRFTMIASRLQQSVRLTGVTALSSPGAASSEPQEQSDRSTAKLRREGRMPLRDAAPATRRAWQGCAPAAWGAGTLVAVTYDGDPAVLAFRRPVGDTQVVELVQCGTGEVLRSVTLSTR